jgi:hypothetical protein
MPAPYEPSMTATIIASIIASLATCGAPDTPPDRKPTERVMQDQHFCCNSVSNGTGEGCTAIGVESINSCASVLYCAEGWEKADGNVTCL